MERITFEGNFCDISMCRENPCPYNGMCSQRQTWERLKQYEDTGLEPEEIKKHEAAYNECLTRTYGPFKQKISQWLQAEQDGRLVVLPCKVGDTVYIPDLEKKIPVKVRVQGISISVSGRTILRFGGYPAESAWGYGCGKDWFLTREEAEAALAQKGGTHEADSV